MGRARLVYSFTGSKVLPPFCKVPRILPLGRKKKKKILTLVDKTGLEAKGARGTVTGGYGSGIEFAVGYGERDGASSEHPWVHVQGGGGRIGDRAVGGVGGHSFVESSFQSCHGEGFAAGQGGDEINDGAKPEHSTDAKNGGAVGGRLEER